MGSYFSTDKSSTKNLLTDADTAVENVTKGQDDLYKKFQDLMQKEMQKQQTDVAALKEAQYALKKHLSKPAGDTYAGKAYRPSQQCGLKEQDGDCECVKKNKKLTEDITSKEKYIKDLESEHKTYIKKLELENERRIRDLETENRRHISELETENGRRIGDLETENRRRISELETENGRRIGELETENRRRIKELETTRSCVAKLESARNEQDTQNQKLRSEKRTLEKDKNQYKSENMQLHQEMTRKTRQIQQLEDEVASLKHQLHMVKQKKVSVSLYCGSQATLTEASDELKRMLGFHWEALGIEATVDQCLDPRTHPASTPLIVLCINASRLGTDVSNALQHINCEPSVAVVILHHKEMHALPSQPSDKLLVGAQYRQIGAIVDIAFLKAKGMYACDMNERALDKLTNFIGSFVRQG
ncbi:WEB family protein At4g27595, chloroplastic-like [Pecten maximus]|uniref:WEB family protein At4g27595, chloroplastic-like n=1 Tax=Pecten maximus TaxID=6579 RepID=UPI001458DAA5|nr:WEB family protein At4g27595, chloroplastic-like [Pecten maximus]